MKNSILLSLSVALLLGSCTSYKTRLKNGHTYAERFMFRRAETAYRKAIRKAPDKASAYINLGRLFLRNGRHGEALLLLQHSLHLEKPQPETWTLLSTYYSYIGDMERASYYVESGLSRFPSCIPLKNQRRRISLVMFIDKCNTLLARYPKARQVRKMLGFRLLSGDLIWLALNHFDRLPDNEPDNKKLFRMLAALFLKKGNTPKAREYLLKLLKADRTDSFALRNMGKIEMDRGYLFKAYRYYFNDAKYHPNNGRAFETVGYLTLRMGKKDKALEYLERAHLLGRRSGKLFASIGYLYASGNSKDARRKGRRFLELAGKMKRKRNETPKKHRAAIIRNRIDRLRQFRLFFSGNRKKEADVRYRIALQYRKLNNHSRAYLELLPAYSYFPLDPSYLLLKAQLELSLGRYGDIIATIRKLDRVNPHTAELFKLKCKLYGDGPMKNRDKYRKTVLSAIRTLPADAVFHLKLAKLHLAEGEHEQALSAFRKAEQNGAAVRQRIVALTELLQLKRLKKQIADTDDCDRALSLALKIRKLLGVHAVTYRESLHKAHNLAPKSAGILTMLGESYAAAFFKEIRYSHLTNACRVLRSALTLYPTHSRAANILNRLLSFDHSGFRSLQKRLELTGRSNALTPTLSLKNRSTLLRKYPEILGSRFFTLGKILFRKNRDAVAVPYIQRSLRLDSKHRIDKLLALGNIQRTLGSFDRAVSSYSDLLKQKKLPEFRQYAIIYATLGNLYTQKTLTYPYNYNYLMKTYLQNGKKITDAVPRIVKVLEESKKLGSRAFQGYIMRNTLIIQRNMGKKKISALMRIPSDSEEVYLRIAALIRSEKNAAIYRGVLLTAAGTLPRGKRRRVLMALAEAYELNGERKKAAARYTQLSKENPNDWRQVYARARWELSRGRLDSSLKTFRKAARLNRRDLGLRIIIGFLHWQKGRMDLAVKELQQVLNSDERNINASYYLCKIYAQMGKFEAAEKHGNRVQELFKKKLPVNYVDRNKKEMLLDTIHTLARVAFLRGNILRSLKYAYAGTGFDNTDSFHFLSLTGDIFYLQKKYTRAEYYYVRAAKHNPTVAFIRFKLARTYLKNGKKLLGHRILEDIYTKIPKFDKRSELLLLLAKVHKQPLEQEKYLKQHIREFPAKQQGYLALAAIYRKQNRFAEQKNILESGLKKIRKAPDIRDAIAWYILDRGRSLRRALHLAKQNIDLIPGNANYRATYGYVLFRLQRFRDSRHNLSARQIAFYRKEDFYRRNDTMENAAEFYRTGRFREAFQLVCYPRPGIYGSRTLFADTLFSRLILKRDSIN